MKIFWAAHTLYVPIFWLAPQQKGFSLQSLPQCSASKNEFDGLLFLQKINSYCSIFAIAF